MTLTLNPSATILVNSPGGTTRTLCFLDQSGSRCHISRTTCPVYFLPLTKWVYDANRERPVYTRPMVGSELIMQRGWNAAGVNESYFGINFTSSLEPEELKRRTRQALDKLRFVSPLIACTVEDVQFPRWVYTPSADRGAWLDLAFAVEDRGASLNTDEFVGTVNARRLPYKDENGNTTLFRVYLLTTSKRGVWSLPSHHSCHRGRRSGTPHTELDVLNGFVARGMNVTIIPSEEWKNLPADPIIATGGPAKEWEMAGKALLQEVAEQRVRTTPHLVLPHPSCPPNEVDMSVPPLRFTMTLSEAQTAAIVAQAKKLCVSVTVLFHAANCFGARHDESCALRDRG
ncbi:hypothetical protein JVU11DRAFT_5648 [Chiua virens]|nr:hypothetical protein JVU11DRAFT_5648 [Chiua virens]